MEDCEIILTRRVAMDPVGLTTTSELNARFGGVRFFETGGPVNPINPISSPSQSPDALSARLERVPDQLEDLIGEVREWPKTLQ